ncbi:MAG: YbaB/EbfC family nucleoid-associated protein [Clostridia bacterium]|nr:YbaB/EbfC family nucleoid-associated protein [Clostridia bacterium]
MAQKFNGFPGGGMGNMAQIMMQAQKMQDDMKKKQAELEQAEYEAVAAGGAVKVVLSGKKEIKNIEIAKDIVDPDDVEMLQDSIQAAVNEALRKLNAEEESVYQGVAGNIKLPF